MNLFTFKGFLVYLKLVVQLLLIVRSLSNENFKLDFIRWPLNFEKQNQDSLENIPRMLQELSRALIN